MFSWLHHKVRTTPWLGRLALRAIPNWKWHLHIQPIGRFVIRLRQHRMFWLRPPLINEGLMLGSLQRLVRPGDAVYDIGANIGLYTRIFLQCFGAAHVFEFEPMESNRHLLAENLTISGLSAQVTILDCAVCHQDGPAGFQIDDLTSNTGALDAVTQGAACESRSQYGLPPATAQVAAARLDTLIVRRKLTPPAVMKIDVEGAEALVLHGAKRLLEEQKPRLVIELHGAEPARQTIEFLGSLGYCCFGWVHGRDARVYQEIHPADLETVTGRYMLPCIAASTVREDLVAPIAEFIASPSSQSSPRQNLSIQPIR